MTKRGQRVDKFHILIGNKKKISVLILFKHIIFTLLKFVEVSFHVVISHRELVF